VRGFAPIGLRLGEDTARLAKWQNSS